MNLIERIKLGRAGVYQGLKSGLTTLDSYVGNIRRGSIDLWGANTKAGKTTIVDYRYILSVIENNIELVTSNQIHWKYYAYEISRIEKEAKFAAYFMLKRHNILVNKDYILSNGNQRLSDDNYEKVMSIYDDIIIPLFGEYNIKGERIKDGYIDYIETKQNPTGIYYDLVDYAETQGKLEFKEFQYTNRETGRVEKYVRLNNFIPTNQYKYHIIIIDHIGKVKTESGYSTKQNLDKLGSYMVEFRNKCNFTFVPISQFNRSMSSIDRFKFSGVQLAPDKRDFKDTGNITEDANFVYGIFNPSEYPHLANKSIDGYDMGILDKSCRFIHLIASREVAAPIKKGIIFNPGNNQVMELPRPDQEELQIIYKRIKNGR